MIAVDAMTLLTGRTGTISELDQTINNISTRTLVALDEILKLPEKEEKHISLYGPYLGRAFLETAFTVLIARLDGFRILSLMHIQSNDKFDIAKRSGIAIQWQGDVVSKEDLDYKIMWEQDVSQQKISRALFGNYFEVVFWRKAYQIVQDGYNLNGNVKILSKYTSSISSSQFIPRIRSELLRYYSSLSKGVHGELVVKTDTVFDKTTVISLLKDVMEVVFAISMVSHCVHTMHTKLEVLEAIELSNKIKEAIDIYG